MLPYTRVVGLEKISDSPRGSSGSVTSLGGGTRESSPFPGLGDTKHVNSGRYGRDSTQLLFILLSAVDSF